MDKGDITWGELFTIQPFGNIVVKKTYTGEQIKAVLEQQFSEEGNTILQISGLHYTWSKEAPIGSKVDCPSTYFTITSKSTGPTTLSLPSFIFVNPSPPVATKLLTATVYSFSGSIGVPFASVRFVT